MALFDWLRPPPHPHERLDDTVWLSEDARMSGVVAAARAVLASGEKVVAGGTSSALAQALKGARGDAAFDVLEPHQLNAGRLADHGRGSRTLLVILAGVMPDPEGEEKLLLQSKSVPCKIRLQVHYSLPELKRFGFDADKLAGMLKALGAGDNEGITHRWVTTAIANARRKKAS